MVKFISSRNNKNQVSASKAIVLGLADDGGLYTPDSFIDVAVKLENIKDLSYQDLAVEILSKYLNDYTFEEISKSVNEAYNTNNFDTEEICPVTKIDSFYLLELYHGPTSAFKDVALTLLPKLLKEAYMKQNLDKKIYILTATSGDTGKAALEGFKNNDNTYISVFYPTEGVAQIQKKQMITTLGNNVDVVGVKGNFDDCQSAVKEGMSKISSDKVAISSANSINIGRLLPQIVYYFSSYLKLVAQNEIKLNDQVNFVVPTGNFGDILAGYFAKEMGLPIAKLICASNSNNVLTEFINTGIYNRNREFIKTISPSMDILVSSNLERLLFILSNYNSDEITSYMKDLKEKGYYKVSDYIRIKMKNVFEAYYCEEKDCIKTIKDAFVYDGRLIDPHTAVAYKCARKFEKNKVNNFKTIVLSTASAYKFAPDVLKAINNSNNDDAYKAIKDLYDITKVEVPSNLKNLDSLEDRFDLEINKEAIEEYISKKVEKLAND